MFEWSNEMILKFLQMYRDKEILWNPPHKYNFNSTLKNYAWVFIADRLSTGLSKTVSSDVCRKKIIF